MSTETLERFKPSGPPEESGKEIELPQEVVTEEEAILALEQLGNVQMGPHSLSNMAKVGVYQTGLGVFKMQRGQALWNQARLNKAMDVLLGAIVTVAETGEIKPVEGKKPRKKKASVPEGLALLTHELGFLSSKMTDSQHLMLEMEQVRPGGVRDDEPKIQASFKAGEEIKPGARIVAQTVHIHEAAQVAAPPI